MRQRLSRTQTRAATVLLLALVLTAVLAGAIHDLAGSAAPVRRTFTIRGTVSGLLAPGVTTPVDLRLTNPHGSALRIRRLAVRVVGIDSPEADVSHRCTGRDFAVAQFSGAYGFTLPRASTRSLSALGIPATRWPRVAMTNRPVNQDGCQHASLSLSFTGLAVGRSL